MKFLLPVVAPACELNPFAALGAALQKAGHQATLLSNPGNETAAARAKSAFTHIVRAGKEPAWTAINTRMQSAQNQSEQLECLLTGLAPCLGDLLDATLAQLPEHDALVTAMPFSFLKLAARKTGKKCATLVSTPNLVPAVKPDAEGASARSHWTPNLLNIFRHQNKRPEEQIQFDRFVQHALKGILPSRNLGHFEGFWSDPAHRALVTVSPALFPPDGTLPANYAYTGFLRWTAALDERAAAELAQVRALEQSGMALPVLVLGNTAPLVVRAQFTRLCAAWPNGAPLVVQAGNTGLTADPSRPEILFVGPMPHEDLFTPATIVIHHGGAETTAAALQVGRPQIIIPRLENEMWWAQATEKLGVTKILSAETWPESLKNTLETILRDVAVMRRVAECATRVRAEDGAAATVRELEKL